MDIINDPTVDINDDVLRDTMKDTEKKMKKVKNEARELMPDLEEIRDDIDSLRSNVVGLARNIRSVTADTARDAVKIVQTRAGDAAAALRDQSFETMERLERNIRAQPGRSVAIAFASGLALSYLLSRRRSGSRAGRFEG
jgi:ElaB/YqjD/DUF883 family membrane-anchored ribosome-binding protein